MTKANDDFVGHRFGRIVAHTFQLGDQHFEIVAGNFNVRMVAGFIALADVGTNDQGPIARGRGDGHQLIQLGEVLHPINRERAFFWAGEINTNHIAAR